MPPRNHRAHRSTVRLGLEVLEGRMLLSATLPAPAPAPTGHIAGSDSFIQGIKTASTLQSSPAATNAYFNYLWSMSPSTVLVGANALTHNHHSTGSVDFALVRPNYAGVRVGSTGNIPLGAITTLSSASDRVPDQYHSAFTLTLRIADGATGATGWVSFKGLVTGTLSRNKSSLTITFQRSLTQKVTLGKHVYSVTVPSSLKPTGPHGAPTMVYVTVGVSNAPTATTRR
jgi:hypothetical protein